MTPRKRPTIKDIARASGFSIGTVDRALHGRKGINPGTREKILSVARELGYETNRVASVLSKNASIVLAALFPRELHYFYDDVRRGFHDAVTQLRDFRVLPHVCEIEALGRGRKRLLRGCSGKTSMDSSLFRDIGAASMRTLTDSPSGAFLW